MKDLVGSPRQLLAIRDRGQSLALTLPPLAVVAFRAPRTVEPGEAIKGSESLKTETGVEASSSGAISTTLTP